MLFFPRKRKNLSEVKCLLGGGGGGGEMDETYKTRDDIEIHNCIFRPNSVFDQAKSILFR